MLFALVSRRLPSTTPTEAKALVRAGAVYIGHLRVRVPTVRVVAGERITVYPEAAAVEPLPQSAVVFIHRDPYFVVLDKPPGVPVAQTKDAAVGTLSDALRRRLVEEGLQRPYVGVVHRLDRGASGLVLFTVRSIANRSLHQQFVEHSIRRTYRLRVHAEAPEIARCDAPLVQRPGGRVEVARDGEPRAQTASTRFRRLAPRVAMPGTSLLEAELHTGRTHQIRVHAATIGHPIVGDERYGTAQGEPGVRLHLHAARLQLTHPIEHTSIDVRAPIPAWAQAIDDELSAPRREDE
jgi:RluA family pseudouridine synthase